MSSSVEPFVALAKGTRGAATAAVIAQALSAPDVFFFYELLQVPSVRDVRCPLAPIPARPRLPHSRCARAPRQLQGTDQQNALALLKIFSYGTWEEYVGTPPPAAPASFFPARSPPPPPHTAARDGLPPLNAAQETKLKQLTVASLAAGARVRPARHLPWPRVASTR